MSTSCNRSSRMPGSRSGAILRSFGQGRTGARRSGVRSPVTRWHSWPAFSQASVACVQSYQNEEFNVAIEQLRLRPHDVTWLIPVRFDDCQIPDRDIGGGRTLQFLHCASLFGHHHHHQQAERLVQVIRLILGGAAESDGRPPSVARNRRAPEISIAEPEISDADFNPPVRSIVYVDVGEPIDDLTACYVTDYDRGGTTGLGHTPFHISTSRWRIRSDFMLRSVREVGSRWHAWKYLNPQAWRRVGSDDLPVYDYVGNTEP